MPIRRRSVVLALGGAALAWPVAATAQRGERPPRIGALMQPGRRPHFERGLQDLGYVVGTSIVIEYRSNADAGQLAELVGLKVDVIVAAGSQAVRAARRATSTIPIVMAAASDPVGTGFVASLARPGGNVTGLSNLSTEMSGKRLQLLAELVPGLSRLAVLLNPDDPPAVLSLKETELAAGTLGIALKAAEIRKPGDFEPAVSSVAAIRPQALVILPAPLMTSQLDVLAKWAVKNRLPSIYPFRMFPEAGGLMSYGPSFDALMPRAAGYADKILKGAKPADLPVEQPAIFELVVNLKTVRELGITVPQSLLARADEVIE